MSTDALWSRTVYRILLFTVPFQTIAVVTLGGFGLQPVYLALVLATIAIPFTDWANTGVRLSRTAISVTGLLAVIFIGLFYWGYTTPAVIPYLNPPRPDRAGQLLYWTAGLGFFLISHIYAANTQTVGEVYRDWQWFLRGGLVAVAIAVYHFLSFYTVLPFPYDVVFSNPSFGINPETRIAGVLRLVGPFAEPSMFSRYIAIALVVAYGLQRRLYVAVFAVALGMALSTTGLIGLVVASGLILFFGARREVARKTMKRAFAVVPVVLLIPTVRRAIYELTIGKVDSISVKQRSAKLIGGLQAWLDYPLLGWGLGAERTNDGLSQVLLNLGIVGTLPFAYLMAVALRVRVLERGRLVLGLKLALATGIALHIVSGPDWTVPYVWVLGGYLWGLPISDAYD